MAQERGLHSWAPFLPVSLSQVRVSELGIVGKAQVAGIPQDNPGPSVDTPAVWNLSDEPMVHAVSAYFSPAPGTILGPGHNAMSNRDAGCELFISIN